MLQFYRTETFFRSMDDSGIHVFNGNGIDAGIYGVIKLWVHGMGAKMRG